jgi:hypothetical protein
MTPARREPEPVRIPQARGGGVEIADGEHDVIDPKHRTQA